MTQFIGALDKPLEQGIITSFTLTDPSLQKIPDLHRRAWLQEGSRVVLGQVRAKAWRGGVAEGGTEQGEVPGVCGLTPPSGVILAV